jgi:hypothetical protein
MTDSLELLESLVPELPQARQAELFGQALQDASRQLEAMKLDIGRLEECQHSIGLLKAFWDGDEEREVVDALHQLEYLGKQIEAAQDQEQLARVTGIASEAKPKILLVLRDGARAWGRRVDHDLGSLGSLGSLLVQFPDTRELGRRMTALAATASSLKSTFPPQEGFLKQHELMLQDAGDIRNNLAAIGAGESVQKFLAALANATATLDMVDDSVLQWIRDRHAESRFDVTLKQGISG